MQDWKQLPLQDKDLVKFLRKKYPPLEYKQGEDYQSFAVDSVFRGGQIDVINAIEHIIALQEKEKSNG